MPKTKNKARAELQPRKLPKPNYESFRLSKRIKHPAGRLPSAPILLKQSLSHVLAHKKLFIVIGIVYLLLSLFFVRQFDLNSGLNEVRDSLRDVLGETDQLVTGLTLFGVLIGSSGSGSGESASTFGFIIFVITSLALIWALRQTYSDSKVSATDSFYRSTYPLIPFLLVMLVIVLQLILMLAGATIYGIVSSNGLAVTGLEQFAWAALFGLLSLLSLYMISSSVFALFIATLPEMTPMKALKSARELVRYRRFEVMRKVLFLPLILLLAATIIMLPFLFWLIPVAETLFFMLGAAGLIVGHSYMYSLYRNLL